MNSSCIQSVFICLTKAINCLRRGYTSQTIGAIVFNQPWESLNLH